MRQTACSHVFAAGEGGLAGGPDDEPESGTVGDGGSITALGFPQDDISQYIFRQGPFVNNNWFLLESVSSSTDSILNLLW